MEGVIHSFAAVEAGVERTVGIHTHHGVPGNTIIDAEEPADEYLAVRKQMDAVEGDTAVRSCSWIEGGVQCTVGEYPGDVVAARAVIGGEAPADDRFTIGLQRDRVARAYNPASGEAGPRIERRVQGAIRCEASDPHAGSAVERGELADQQDLSIRL